MTPIISAVTCTVIVHIIAYLTSSGEIYETFTVISHFHKQKITEVIKSYINTSYHESSNYTRIFPVLHFILLHKIAKILNKWNIA